MCLNLGVLAHLAADDRAVVVGRDERRSRPRLNVRASCLAVLHRRLASRYHSSVRLDGVQLALRRSLGDDDVRGDTLDVEVQVGSTT